NRLASNSLLEAVVFSDAIFKYIRKNILTIFPKVSKGKDLKNFYSDVLDWNDKGTLNADEWVLISHDKREIKEIMNDYVGIVRNTVRLQRAFRRIKMMREEIKEYYKRTKVTVELLELRNLVLTAYMIIESAMKRKESRGLHYMLDYPKRNDKQFKKDTRLVKH
ncbi:MAG: L-aspartate oxidase, partial [Ignavibacteria bacterium]